MHIPTDVRQRGDLERLVALGCERFGRLDVLVSNAGVMPIGPLADLAVTDWEQMIDVIQTASTAARKTVPNRAVYAGTRPRCSRSRTGCGRSLPGTSA